MNREKFEAFNRRNRLDIFSVRISNGKNGSGVLYIPKQGDYGYIFTVAHIVEKYITGGDSPNFYTKYGEVNYEKDKLDKCLIYKANEDGSYDIDFYDDEYTGNSKDVAVFRIHKKFFEVNDLKCEEINYAMEENVIERSDFAGFGFPNNSTNKVELFGTINEWIEDKKLFVCSSEKNVAEFVESMKGYSGTGLFVENEHRLALAGLVVSCERHEQHMRFYAVGLSEIIEQITVLGWDTPKKENEYCMLGKFVDDTCDCIEIIEQRYGNNLPHNLQDIFYRLIKEYSPQDLAKNEQFFNIPVCHKHRQACPYYWAGKLFLLIYYYTKNNGNHINSDYCWKDNIKIKYICSEGKGEADIGTVVRSVVESKVLTEEFAPKSIIVWQSKEKPQRRILVKKKMSSHIENILKEDFGKARKEGYYLMSGEIKEREYGMVHLGEFIDSIANLNDDEITMDGIKNAFEEVMEYAWK